MASERRSNVPASTSSRHRRSYSSADPSHQWMVSGSVSSAISSTQEISLRFSVGASVVADEGSLKGWISSSLARAFKTIRPAALRPGTRPILSHISEVRSANRFNGDRAGSSL